MARREAYDLRENVRKNLAKWDRDHAWPQDGDEWSGQAEACGVSYVAWKDSLVRHLLAPNVAAEAHILEIAPGHGRWTEYLAALAGHVTIVDISASCLDFCRRRFQGRNNIDYALTTGDWLPPHLDGRIDFVWSFDSFVHMDRDVIRAYLGEIRRVLKIGGTAILHHSHVGDPAMHRQDTAPGWRAAMSMPLMRELAEAAGLAVMSQFTYWDEANRIGVPHNDDRITHLRKEAGAGAVAGPRPR